VPHTGASVLWRVGRNVRAESGRTGNRIDLGSQDPAVRRAIRGDAASVAPLQRLYGTMDPSRSPHSYSSRCTWALAFHAQVLRARECYFS